MKAVVRLTLKEMWKKKWKTLLVASVCMVGMNSMITSMNHAYSVLYQQKMLEEKLAIEPENLLHLHFDSVQETQEFVQELDDVLASISALDNVLAAGQFDVSGELFYELSDSQAYQQLNQAIVKDTKYENHPEIVQVLTIDEALLALIDHGIYAFRMTESGALPMYASEAFKEIVGLGMILTEQRTGAQYEIIGYFPEEAKWFQEDDLIRYPLVSMKGWFVAPYSEKKKIDVMTQLSSLHNTYVLLENHAQIDQIKDKIHESSFESSFDVTAGSLYEEIMEYQMETDVLNQRQAGLAVFIAAMTLSSLSAVFTTNALLKKRHYGIMVANGFTKTEIAWSIATEILILLFAATGVIWCIQLGKIKKSADLFKSVLLAAHVQWTLPIVILAVFVLAVTASVLPVLQVWTYQPHQLMRENQNEED